jgi:hypothetical protein
VRLATLRVGKSLRGVRLKARDRQAATAVSLFFISDLSRVATDPMELRRANGRKLHTTAKHSSSEQNRCLEWPRRAIRSLDVVRSHPCA